jgi:Transglutaminase-like superfamily
MWKRIQQFSALTGSERGLFLLAFVFLPLTSVSFRWRGFRKTKASFQYFLPVQCGSQSPDAPARAALTSRMVRAAAYHGIGDPTCLEQSLVLWWLLARQGISSDLRVGVRKGEAGFEAHAWVECGGVVLDDPEKMHQHFGAFDGTLASLPHETR